MLPQPMVGTYEGRIDAKGRLFLPASFRVKLGETLMAIAGTEACLKLYGGHRLAELQGSGILPLDSQGAYECAVDSQGRIVIPKAERDRAWLVDRFIAVGMGDHLEVWNAETFEKKRAETQI